MLHQNGKAPELCSLSVIVQLSKLFWERNLTLCTSQRYPTEHVPAGLSPCVLRRCSEGLERGMRQGAPASHRPVADPTCAQYPSPYRSSTPQRLRDIDSSDKYRDHNSHHSHHTPQWHPSRHHHRMPCDSHLDRRLVSCCYCCQAPHHRRHHTLPP